MLRCHLICIGKLKENYWREAVQEYEKRLRSFCKFSITELIESRLPDRPCKAQIQSALDSEAERILSAAGNSVIVALCIEGKSFSSVQLADFIRESGVRGISDISFIIGSSYGLSDMVKDRAMLKLSMSAMTFPHQLARVMLCEQVYRAFQIMNNGKYHK